MFLFFTRTNHEYFKKVKTFKKYKNTTQTNYVIQQCDISHIKLRQETNVWRTAVIIHIANNYFNVHIRHKQTRKYAEKALITQELWQEGC